jgi:2'-5' RNA ligase
MGSARPTDRLFFAAIPDSSTAALIAERAWMLREVIGLDGKPLAASHLHVTLWHVGDAFRAPPAGLIDALVWRTSGIAMPTFRVSFDRAMSFRNGAFVLCGEEGVSGLEILHDRLDAALGNRRTRRTAKSFTPHMTLLRDKRLVPLRPIEPIDWTVSELVLVHSLLGRTTHRHVARLPLLSRPPSGRGK